MNDLYTCTKCLSKSTYFVMPSGTTLKCMDCEHTWPFTFIVFILEDKNANVCAGIGAN
jgi:hypothetical protein